MQRYDLERTAESDREGGTVWVTAMEPDAVGKWVRHADAEAELSALRARVAELEAMQKALHLGIASDAGIIRELRERLATLEAPPVVPRGWKVFQWPDGDWCWAHHCDELAPPGAAVYRAVAWAIEHDQRPPHASDGMATPEPPKPARKVLPVGHIPGPDGVRVGMVLRWTLYDNAIVNRIEFGSAYTTRGTVRLDTAGRMSLAAPFEVPND